jgi:protein YIPF3
MSQEHGNAVIDMSNVDEIVGGDIYDQNPRPTSSSISSESKSSESLFSMFGSTVWQEGRKRAESAMKPYASIDILRPYFDVEPNDILRRLMMAFVPIHPAKLLTESIPAELYGPTMICFTLVALLLHEMKYSGHTVAEGTLMGSALLTVFGYWMGVSAVLWTVAYVCSVQLRPMQINTILGYAMTGDCVVVLLSALIHAAQSHILFYVLWIVAGGLTSVRMVCLFSSRTEGRTEKIVVSSVAVVLHMCFMLYLHFAYHEVVKEVSKLMNEKAR